MGLEDASRNICRERPEGLGMFLGQSPYGYLWVAPKKALGPSNGFHLGDPNGVSGLSKMNEAKPFLGDPSKGSRSYHLRDYPENYDS